MAQPHTSASGTRLPALGFGTYTLRGDAGITAIASALEAGYRLLDSAVNYENEGTVGRAVRESGVPREDVVVTSKLPGRHHAFEEARRTIEESLYRTGLDYIDLYLIHWPNPKRRTYVEAWQALIEARERGLVRSIGVSNFLPEHIDRLEGDTGVLPEVNQIELHPYFPQTPQLVFHRESGILTESWSPLGRKTDLLREPVLREIGERHGASPAQVVLAWHVARGAIPIPKSADPARQRDNLSALDLTLSGEEVERITALGRRDGRVAGQDPAEYEEF